MDYVLTLVAPVSGPDLSSLASLCADRLHSKVCWLEPERAADLALDISDPGAVREHVKEMLGGEPVDMALQPRHGRKKKLLVGDMDSTFITVECIDVLAARTGLGDAVAAITRRSMAGELDFTASLRERVSLLKGAPESLLDDVWRNDVAMMPGGKTLLATMRHHGATTALVSGGFTWFTERVAAELGFDCQHANTLAIRDGVLTGDVVDPVLDRDAKRRILGELCRKHAISIAESLTVGDGANDVAMLQAAGLGVAYHPTPPAARAGDVIVRHGDLTTLLYFQGYKRSQFIT